VIAGAFPIRHLFEALLAAYDPLTAGAGYEPVRLAALAAWGAIGLLLAVRFFRWSPRGG
jgi:ABC-2 type transport system permease protein